MKSDSTKQRPPWIIRTYAGFGDAQATNQRFRENIVQGQTGLSVAFDLPTQNGYDPDHDMSRGEVGGCGVSIAHYGDVKDLFDGIDIATTNTSMTINATAPYLLASYLVLAQERGVPWTSLHGTVQNDLMKEFVARGTSIFNPQTSLRLSADVIAFASEHLPHWNPINVCGYHYMESGAGPKEEIGLAFGNALLVLDAIRPRLATSAFETVVRRISFFINSGIELVPEICKMRAYSRLWTILCREEFGIENVRFRAGCQVRSLTLPAQQPELNIIRIALEALPAILSADARVNALQLPGFREALSLPDEMEQRLSLRTQQILMHETGIANHGDIFNGNAVIENLTEEYIKDARCIAGELRSMGYETAIQYASRTLLHLMAQKLERFENGTDRLVGVNCFSDSVGLTEQLPVAPATAQSEEFQCTRKEQILRWKSGRNASTLTTAIGKLREAVLSEENIMPSTLEFVRAGGTVGEWSATIESVTNGRYREHIDFSSSDNPHLLPQSPIRLKLVLGKAGLDGHTNAIKTLALACRNAGLEVVFAGTRVTPEALIKTALEEDADVLAVSSLSGAHLTIARSLAELRTSSGINRLKIAIGGTIPERDVPTLYELGLDLVVSSKDQSLSSIVKRLIQLVEMPIPA